MVVAESDGGLQVHIPNVEMVMWMIWWIADNPQVKGIATVFEGRVFKPNLLIRHKGSQRIFSSISS